MTQKIVRIGGASGFWGDSSVGAPQLVASGQIDYLVFDYLAELTMSILAGARLKKPELGYATDFVSVAMKSVLREVVARGIRVVSNAGGVNPEACAAALAALAESQGLTLKIAVVPAWKVKLAGLMGEMAGTVTFTVNAVTADLAKASPQGLTASKALTTAVVLAGFDRDGERLAEESARLFVSEEAREGMLAFLQKRPPRWAAQ